MLGRKNKNQKLATIRRRQFFADVIFSIIALPLVYAMIAMTFCL